MLFERKYADLLKDSDVKRWYDNLNASSTVTSEVYLRTLGLYCQLNNTTPRRILKEATSKQFHDRFMDFVRKMESEGKAGSYIERFRKVLISWLSHNRVKVELKVNIAGRMETPTLRNERIPTTSELSKILRMANPRTRVSISLMAFSGLRPESLGNHRGTDGIVLGDFKEAKIDAKEGIVFAKTPSMLTVRPSLSKARHEYFTLVGEEGSIYVKDYLQRRIEAGEKLSPE
ncbi:MAG TPA: hypothetical protein VLX56_06370, partial [Nitrososphaerales archaeon]|nr:hypothetical protein [Nitrososphaerales archaeon]